MADAAEPAVLLDWMHTLSDLARVRVLFLLDEPRHAGELSVGELAAALQLPQSTVSRHLKVLADRGWVVKRPVGTSTLYQFDREHLSKPALELWALTREQMSGSPTIEDDLARLKQVLTERRTRTEDFFGRLGAEWDQLRGELFGESFTSEALLFLLSPDHVVADLGCGTGDVAALLAPVVQKVIAVDREPTMLDAAVSQLSEWKNVEIRHGDLYEPPIADEEVDAAIVSLVLHHVEQPVEAVRQMARILKRGGRCLILDMVRHDRESYRQTMGHKHLGFDPDAVKQWAETSGLHMERYERLRPKITARGPGLFVATLVRR